MSHLSYFGGGHVGSQKLFEREQTPKDIAREIIYDIINILLENVSGEDTLLKNS